jgi:hypothetical protein
MKVGGLNRKRRTKYKSGDVASPHSGQRKTREKLPKRSRLIRFETSVCARLAPAQNATSKHSFVAANFPSGVTICVRVGT